MRVIFAPWRMEYILGQKPDGCVLCDALGKGVTRESLVLYVSDKAFVMMNRYPYSSGHLMVVPRSHVGAPDMLDPAEWSDVNRLVRLSIKVLRRAFNPDGFNIGMNLGKAAGAGITDHCHVHVLPRWSGDTNFISTVGELRVIPQALESTFDKLLPLFKEEEADT